MTTTVSTTDSEIEEEDLKETARIRQQKDLKETAMIRQQIITDIQISVVLNNIHNILNNIQYFLIIFLIVIFMSCISYLIN